MLKTGPHFMTGGSGYGTWLGAGVTVTKGCFAYPQDDPRGALYIGRSERTDYVSPQGNPIMAAREFFKNSILMAALANRHIKVWEGANEPEWKYDWSLDQCIRAMEWYGSFDAELCRLGAAQGLKMVVGNWAVTTPGRTGPYGENLNDLWVHYREALAEIVRGGHYHGAHMYGPLDETFAFRFKANHRQFSSMGFGAVRHILTEVGAENAGPQKPWRIEYGSIDAYLEKWIVPFEQEIRKADYVVGACLFTIGSGADSRWDVYDVAGTTLPDRMVVLSKQLGDLPVSKQPPTPPATYVVQRGDTLIGIARKLGIPNWKTLADLNGITDPRTLRVGQVLKIPGSGVKEPPPPPPPPPAGIRYYTRADWGADRSIPRLGYQVPPPARTGVVIHHTVGVDRDSTPVVWETEGEIFANMRALQRIRPDLGLDVPYNFVVYMMADGTLAICEGRGWGLSGAHTAHRNTSLIAFSFAGNFEIHPPPFSVAALGTFIREQKTAQGLLNLGRESPPGRDVFAHRDFYPTACCGKHLFSRLGEIRYL